jgi:hypothetical protein
VASLLKDSGWTPIRSDNGTFEALKKQVALYNRIESEEAWKDYQYRLSQLRDATRSAIERGGLDKYGNRHDDEQRSVLFMVDSLLTYVPAIQEQYKQVLNSLKADEAKAGTPLYGDDVLTSLTSSL